MAIIYSFGPHDVVQRTSYMEQLYPKTKHEYLAANTGAETIEFMKDLDVDLAVLGNIPAAQASLQNLDYKIIYVAQIIGRDEALVTKPSVKCESPQGSREGYTAHKECLEGLALATPYISTAHYTLARYLDLIGAENTEIKIMGPEAIAKNWELIDGAYIWGKFITQLTEREAIIHIDSSDLWGENIGTTMVVMARTGFWAEYPEYVRHYVRGLDDAVHDMRKDPEAAAIALLGGPEAEATRAEVNELKGKIGGDSYFTHDEQFSSPDLLGDGARAAIEQQLDAAQFLKEVGAWDGLVSRISFTDMIINVDGD